MDALTYPVIFEKDKDGYFVTVPDLDRMTQGTDLTDAIANARDAICLTIVDLEDDGKPVPPPSHSVKTPDNGFVSYVDANIAEYRKKYGSKTVRKNVSIPAWLNTKAENLKINFSQALQEALIAKINEH